MSLPSAARGPTTIDAQRIEGVSELEVTARGRVEFKREDLSVYSEFLRYNQEFGRIEADGGVRFLRGPDRFFGPRLRYDTRNDTGVFEEPTFLMGRDQVSRGNAERIEFLGRNRLRLIRASYTTCEPGDDAWRIEARELELDFDKEEGHARDMRLRLLDTTVFAFPAASFPLENRRKSGFLAPYYSHNTRRGLELAVPYYINIAPEQDATITPVAMSKRGEQIKGQYRRMSADSNTMARLEYLPRDEVLNRPRSGFSLQHDHRLTPNLTAKVDYNKVSDDRYFIDLSSLVRQVSIGNLQREAQLNYASTVADMPAYLQARVQRFQTLQDPLSPQVSPYHRAPQFNFGISKTEFADTVDISAPGEFVRFVHPSLTDGSRFRVMPEASLPLLSPGAFFTPKVGFYASQYNLQKTAAGQPSRQTLSLPWFSLDSGLTFERDANLFGNALTQTFEPRAYYAYVPYRNQSQTPIFDTALADFTYSQLFQPNRFVGGDRFGDANQVTLVGTTRFLGAGGQEIFRAALGQRYYFKNERVGLTATSPLRSRDQSDLLASVGGRVAQSWTVDSTMQYNPQESRTERVGISARFSPEIAKVINASYRFNRDVLRQADISGQWPVAAGWYAIGRYNYSLRDRRVLEGLAGLEYNAGCWVFRGVFQRLQAAALTTSTAIFVQLEFNGLGQIGSDDTVDFLKRTLPGYARTNPSDPALVPPSLRPRLPFEQVF